MNGLKVNRNTKIFLNLLIFLPKEKSCWLRLSSSLIFENISFQNNLPRSFHFLKCTLFFTFFYLCWHCHVFKYIIERLKNMGENNTHTHTHTYIYIYVCVCVCVYVCVCAILCNDYSIDKMRICAFLMSLPLPLSLYIYKNCQEEQFSM